MTLLRALMTLLEALETGSHNCGVGTTHVESYIGPQREIAANPTHVSRETPSTDHTRVAITTLGSTTTQSFRQKRRARCFTHSRECHPVSRETTGNRPESTLDLATAKRGAPVARSGSTRHPAYSSRAHHHPFRCSITRIPSVPCVSIPRAESSGNDTFAQHVRATDFQVPQKWGDLRLRFT